MENPTKERYVKEILIIATPTNSGKADMTTVRKLDQLPILLQKGYCPVVSMKKGLSRGRSEAIRQLKIHLDKNNIKHDGYAQVLWFDDDLILGDDFDIRKLAVWINEADKNGWNLIANYVVPWHDHEEAVLFHNRGASPEGRPLYQVYSYEEVMALTEMQELKDTVGGMGFMYVRTPLDYEFYDDKNGGEDMHFCLDTQALFHYIPMPLFHEKRGYVGWGR